MAFCIWTYVIVYSAVSLSTEGVPFKTYPGTRTYGEAITFCQDQAMRLPVIKSPFDQQLALDARPASPEYEYWIGLDYQTDTFLWRDNSSMCWENWIVSASNEPNNLATELCVVMRGLSSQPGVWLTKSCNTAYGTMCQVVHQDSLVGNIYNKIDNKAPSLSPIATLQVAIERACLVFCNMIADCLMITYDQSSRVCSVHSCSSYLTDTPLARTWIKL